MSDASEHDSTTFVPAVGVKFCSIQQEGRPSEDNKFVPRYLEMAKLYFRNICNVPTDHCYTKENKIVVRGSLKCKVCKVNVLNFGKKSKDPNYCFKVNTVNLSHQHSQEELQAPKRSQGRDRDIDAPQQTIQGGDGDSVAPLDGDFGAIDALLSAWDGLDSPPPDNTDGGMTSNQMDADASKRLRKKPESITPAEISDFVGRNELLDTLQNNREHFLVLEGEQGAGKTYLARYFSYRWFHENNDRLLYFISIGGRDTMMPTAVAKNALWLGYEQILKCLEKDLDRRDYPTLEAITKSVMQELHGVSTTYEWMLVLDDVPDMKEPEPWFLRDILPIDPDENGHVLITTRSFSLQGNTSQSLCRVDPIRVKPWSHYNNKDAIKLLLDNAGEPQADEQEATRDIEAARNLTVELGGLPLAVMVVGRLIRSEKSSIWRYWNDHKNDLIGKDAVSVVLNDALDKARSFGANAALDVLSYVHPNSIPAELLCNKEVEINVLTDRKLLEKTGDNVYSMHELLQKAAMDQQVQNVRMRREKGYELAVEALEPFVNNFNFYDSETWSAGSQWVSHVEALLANLNKIVQETELSSVLVLKLARVLKCCAEYHEVYHDYKDAERYFLTCVDLHEGIDDHKEQLCEVHFNLGFLLAAMARRKDDSLKHSRKSLDMAKQLYGENSEQVAMRKKNVGLALRHGSKEDVKEALIIFDEVLSQLGKPADESAAHKIQFVYNNKGLAYMKLDQYIEAIECFKKALDLDGYKPRNEHECALNMGNIAECLIQLDKKDAATEYAEKAVLKFRQIYGEKTNSSVDWTEELLRKCFVSESV